MDRRRVVIVGMGDTGVLSAIALARQAQVTGISTRPALVSGQELGNRLADPEGWKRNFLVPFERFRGLDRVRSVHGRTIGVDLEARRVRVALAAGGETSVPYDVLVIASGVANGFWRHDRVEGLDEVEAGIRAIEGPAIRRSRFWRLRHGRVLPDPISASRRGGSTYSTGRRPDSGPASTQHARIATRRFPPKARTGRTARCILRNESAVPAARRYSRSAPATSAEHPGSSLNASHKVPTST